MLFSVFIEFIGLTFFSLLMGLMSSFFAGMESGFDDFLSSKMFQCDLWIRKIERTNKGEEFSCKLYMDICQYVEDAFRYDFNLIVEEFPFFY